MGHSSSQNQVNEPEPPERYPIGFKLFVVLAALYLLLRLVQGVQWLIERFGS